MPPAGIYNRDGSKPAEPSGRWVGTRFAITDASSGRAEQTDIGVSTEKRG
jgi:hypothetical protein